MKFENGKQLRILLSPDDMAKMREAKVKVEAETHVVMSDAQFVLGLVRWALREKSSQNQ